MLAYFCLFALHPCLLPSPCPSLQMTLPNPALGFPLKEGQSGRIYPSEIKRRKEKEPMGASQRKDCISSREPQDGHTGQQTSNTDSLHSRTPTLEREISHMFLGFFGHSLGNKENLHSICTLCLFLSHIYLHIIPFLSHECKYTHAHIHAHI